VGLFDRLLGRNAGTGTPATEIYAPVDGELIAIEDVADPVFSGKVMGDGMAVVPDGSMLCAPATGTLAVLFPTGHAFGVETGALSVMVHAGIDTVGLGGKGFSAKASQGDAVKTGAPVVGIDVAAIRAAGYDPTVMVVVTEPAQGQLVKRASGPVKAGERIMWFE
jgi:glucose-specific phosphotransferase system IIA component